MHAVNLIFPHQLFKNSPIIQNGLAVYLVEEFLFFQQYPFHKQKIAFHRATMKYYEHYLTSKGVQVNYINAQNEFSDVRQLITALSKQDIKILHYIDTIDHWLEKRIQSSADKTHIECIKHPSLLFLNTKEELQTFFKPEKKSFFRPSFTSGNASNATYYLTEHNDLWAENGVLMQKTGRSILRIKYPRLLNILQPILSFMKLKITLSITFQKIPGS
jgi:deoxyribodipyrimidine photolyase-like uncharacterized protein